MAPISFLLAVTLVPVAVIDVRRRVIPDAITGPAAGVVLLLALGLDAGSVPGRLAWAAGAGAFFLAAALACPAGMGMGDVKLASLLGLALERGVVLAVVVALLAGTLYGALVVVRLGLREGRRATLPFAPFLALGAVAALL